MTAILHPVSMPLADELILLVGHGSREPSGNAEIEAFAAQWRQRQPQWQIDTCFIEFAEVLLGAGLRRAARKGRRVIVVPLILNAAGHVKMEIPQHIAQARHEFPLTEFIYAPHLTACDPILAILKRKLKQAMEALDMPDPVTTGVIVLGRGSSDRQANGEMAKMARWLMEEGNHPLVDLAFTGITWPRLETAVQRQIKLGMTQVVVLPYYLFSGTLVERIGRQIGHLRQQYPTVRFASSTYFGFEREIFELLETRVAALQRGEPAAAMPCDGCKFREFAEEHGHGIHHHGPDDHHAHEHHAPTSVRAEPVDGSPEGGITRRGEAHAHSPSTSSGRTAENHQHHHDHAHPHHEHVGVSA